MNHETESPEIQIVPVAAPPPPEPVQQPSTLRKLFWGKDGLRAGWALLIFIAIFAGLAFCVNRALHALGVPRPDPKAELSPLVGILGEGGSFLLLVVVTWIMSKIERRSFSVYGMGDQRKLRHFLAGMAWGIVGLSILIFTLRQAGFLVMDHRLLFGADILRYGALWLLGFFLVGLLEENLTRGYVQYTLTRGLAAIYLRVFKTQHSTALGFWTSAIIFSILFGLGHKSNPGESPIGLLSAGTAGLVFCFSLWRTGSLWWAIGIHTSWDWGQSFLYGVADSGLMVQHHLFATHAVGKPILSGGATGPEGSIFILAVLALLALIIVLTLPRGHYGREASAFE